MLSISAICSWKRFGSDRIFVFVGVFCVAVSGIVGGDETGWLDYHTGSVMAAIMDALVVCVMAMDERGMVEHGVGWVLAWLSCLLLGVVGGYSREHVTMLHTTGLQYSKYRHC